jgi:acetyl esterase
MALDGPSAALMRQLAELGGPPLHTLPVSDARAGANAMLGILGQGPEMAWVEEYILPADGEASAFARWCRMATSAASSSTTTAEAG